jgi:ABC-type multidrug transport system fused ATPase/permease subunit
VLCFAAYRLIVDARSGAVLPGELTFLIGGLVSFTGTLSRIAINVRELCKDGHLVSEFFEVLDLSGEPERGRAEGTRVEGCPRIAFENVSFVYPRSKEDDDGVSLVFEPGKKYAIVGPSGAGKSTLVSLLCGLHRPTSGTVSVNGADLATLEEDRWRSTLGILIQKFLGSEKPFGAIPDEELLEAVKKAKADEIVVKKPKGLRQLVGKGFKNGTGLSLGQLQRIRIAGVHVGNRSVLVLDEPTAIRATTTSS